MFTTTSYFVVNCGRGRSTCPASGCFVLPAVAVLRTCPTCNAIATSAATAIPAVVSPPTPTRVSTTAPITVTVTTLLLLLLELVVVLLLLMAVFVVVVAGRARGVNGRCKSPSFERLSTVSTVRSKQLVVLRLLTLMVKLYCGRSVSTALLWSSCDRRTKTSTCLLYTSPSPRDRG